MANPYVINMNFPSDEHKAMLVKLLQSDKEKKVWREGIYFLGNDTIHLKQWFIQRPKKNGDSCYEVMDSAAFAEGGFSTLHNSFFNLGIKNNSIEINEKSRNRRAVKYFSKVRKGFGIDEIKKEANITQQIEYMHAKELVIDGENCFIVMKKLPTLTLSELLKNRSELSFRQRNNLSIALINRLKYFHDAGYLHRDVKPENILISQEGDEFTVYLIDCTFSALKTDRVTSSAGTPPYAGFECYLEKTPKNYKTDIRALGRVLMFVWGEMYSKDENSAFSNRDTIIKYAIQPGYKHLYEWLPEKPAFHNELTDCYMSMCATEPSDRPELDDVLEIFQGFDKRCDEPGIPHTLIKNGIDIPPSKAVLESIAESPDETFSFSF